MMLAGIVLFLVLFRLPASAGPVWAERLAQVEANRGRRKNRT
jgi:hypothetical protein